MEKESIKDLRMLHIFNSPNSTVMLGKGVNCTYFMLVVIRHF